MSKGKSEDADVRRDFHGALDDVAGRVVGLGQEGPRGGQGEVAARSDGDDSVVRLDQLPRTAQEEAVLQVGDYQQGLEPAEHPVAPPVLGQLDRGAGQVTGIAVELLLELLVQGKRVRHRSGEAGQDLAALQGAHLVRLRLDHGLADADLAVSAERDAAVFSNAENCGAVKASHDA
jgi:hypothetical protein